MADQKITQLSADATPTSDDLVVTVNDPGGTPVNRKVTLLDILKGAALGVLTSDNDVPARISGALTRVPVAASRIVGRKASGDLTALTGAEAGDLIGVYQAYTPTIAQNGTRTTSSIAGRYMQVGKWVHCYGNATISNTGTAGQVLTVTVPVAASGGFGHGLFYDASTTSQYPGTMIFQSGTTIGLYVTGTTGNSAVGANPNVAVATGDALFWNVTYEAA